MKIVIMDGTNQYIKSYIVDPTISRNSGHPIGGIIGMMKTLQSAVNKFSPDRIYVCWDGKGSSKKRRETNEGYKEGRAPIRLNRESGLSEEEERQNRMYQQIRTIDFMNNMPIAQIMIEGIEADDVISELHKIHKEDEKIIISSDKDFLQLLDDKTLLDRPAQKDQFTLESAVETFGIHPVNFALARAMVGDNSDNLPGIKGVGLKTVANRFPFLLEEKSFTIDEVVEHCQQPENTQKVYESVLLGKELITQNYQMMQLYVPLLTAEAREVILNAVENYPQEFKKSTILKMMAEDGFPFWNFDALYASLNNIIYKIKKEK